MRKIQTMVLLLAVVLAACNTEGKKAGEAVVTAEAPVLQKETVSAESNETKAAGSEKMVEANIRLVITGGEMAGTYEAICMDGGCSYGLAGENIFGLQYSETGKAENELSSVQMIIPEVRGDKTSSEFNVTISFGEIFIGRSYIISTLGNSAANKGKGRLKLTYANDKATVNIKGETEDGVKVDLWVECQRVITEEVLRKELGI